MKNLITTKGISLVAAGLTMLTSCQDMRIKGSGKVVTENRHVDEFNSIDAEKGLEVIIEQAPTHSVKVVADDNVIGNISTKVKDGVLYISSEYNSFIDVSSKKVFVQAPEFREIETSAGVSMRSANVLNSTKLSVDASTGSAVNIEIEAEEVISETSSGSSVTLSGKALSLDISASSGSQNDARRLAANDVRAQASSGSSVHVQPILSLEADASSGGSIKYYKEPRQLSKDVSSGGSISAP